MTKTTDRKGKTRSAARKKTQRKKPKSLELESLGFSGMLEIPVSRTRRDTARLLAEALQKQMDLPGEAAAAVSNNLVAVLESSRASGTVFTKNQGDDVSHARHALLPVIQRHLESMAEELVGAAVASQGQVYERKRAQIAARMREELGQAVDANTDQASLVGDLVETVDAVLDEVLGGGGRHE